MQSETTLSSSYHVSNILGGVQQCVSCILKVCALTTYYDLVERLCRHTRRVKYFNRRKPPKTAIK